jgi:hypothetical protein
LAVTKWLRLALVNEPKSPFKSAVGTLSREVPKKFCGDLLKPKMDFFIFVLPPRGGVPDA